MKEIFEDFQGFESTKAAEYVLLNLLDEYQIPYELANNRTETDVIKGNVSWVHPVIVKLHPSNFDKVNLLLEQKAEEHTYIPTRHYLFSFKDSELVEILQKPDEWSREDYVIAKKLLQQRGKNISESDLNKFKEDRMKLLTKPESVEKAWIYAGFASALAGGVIAIFFGRIIYSSKKTLPNGKKVFRYDASSREEGFIIFVAGIVAWIIYLIVFFMKYI